MNMIQGNLNANDDEDDDDTNTKKKKKNIDYYIRVGDVIEALDVGHIPI